MTTQRLCDPQGQPCTRNCGIDCHWNTAEVETPHEKALPVTMFDKPAWHVRALDSVGNAWDELNELGKICAVVCGVAICFVAAVAAVEAMT